MFTGFVAIFIFPTVKDGSILQKRNIVHLFKNANYAQTECQFRYCGTAIPFLTVRSTAR